MRLSSGSSRQRSPMDITMAYASSDPGFTSLWGRPGRRSVKISTRDPCQTNCLSEVKMSERPEMITASYVPGGTAEVHVSLPGSASNSARSSGPSAADVIFASSKLGPADPLFFCVLSQPNPHGLPKRIDFIFWCFESSWFQVGRKERVAREETSHSGGFQPYSRVLPRLLRGARGRIARVIAGGACPGRPGGRVGRGKSRTLSWAVTQRKFYLPDLFRPDEGDTRVLSDGQKRSGRF